MISHSATLWKARFSISQSPPLIPARIQNALHRTERQNFSGTLQLGRRLPHTRFQKGLAMVLSSRITDLWNQMIYNLNMPDWASRHLGDPPSSLSLPPVDPLQEMADSSLEIALRQMGLLIRQSDSPPP